MILRVRLSLPLPNITIILNSHRIFIIKQTVEVRIMKCENCPTEYDVVLYGSGRFCSGKCARSFSTKNKRFEINKKVSEKLKGRIGKSGVGFKVGFDENRRPFSDEDRLKAVVISKRRRIEKMSNTPFEKLSNVVAKRMLILERGHKCERCNNTHWLNNIIKLELDHMDGNNRNNSKSNLQLLCPNCHSFTDTWKGGNTSRKQIKISDGELLECIKSTKNIRQALIKAGLTAKGKNYDRINELKILHNI